MNLPGWAIVDHKTEKESDPKKRKKRRSCRLQIGEQERRKNPLSLPYPLDREALSRTTVNQFQGRKANYFHSSECVLVCSWLCLTLRSVRSPRLRLDPPRSRVFVLTAKKKKKTACVVETVAGNTDVGLPAVSWAADG